MRYFIGVIVLVGSFFLTFEKGIELLNYGALIAFMGVNASSFTHYFVVQSEKKVTNFIIPIVGFLVCLGLWWNLSVPAKIVICDELSSAGRMLSLEEASAPARSCSSWATEGMITS